jgi:hypothetical protein
MTPEVRREETLFDQMEQHVVTVGDSSISNVTQVATDVRTSPLGDIDERLVINFAERSSTYYSVTEAEIEVYAQFGWLSSIFLTLFGTFSGFSLGCVAAIVQGNIPTATQTVLWWLTGTTGIISAILLVIAIVLVIIQNKNKKTWKSTE